MGKEKEKVVCVWSLYLWVVLFCSCCVVECRGGEGEEERDMVVVVVVSMLLGCITGCVSALVCGCLVSFIFRYIKRPPLLKGPVVFSPLISPKSLQSALVQNQNPTTSDTNSNLVILLDNGLTVSMKKLQVPCLKKKNRRRIQRELHILGSLRHTSLLPLLAYYVTTHHTTTTTFYLVYDYLPSPTEEEEGGCCTLHDAIIGRSRSRIRLPWEARLRIAVGIIKGLHYLHLSCSPPVLHYDLQPSNVLLDSHFQPHLALSGLPNTFHLLRSPTSPPYYYYYYAPECFPNFTIYTEKSDIFSFGVILGMLLTGRDPSDPLFGSGMGIWFRQVLEAGDGREALDKTLLGQEMEEDEMLMAVRIAAVCLSDMPLDRPSTDELLPMLTQLHSF